MQGKPQVGMGVNDWTPALYDALILNPTFLSAPIHAWAFGIRISLYTALFSCV